MSEFFVDFAGYCKIEAETEDEARYKFWETNQPPSTECDEDWQYNDVSIEPVDPIPDPEYLQKLQETTCLQKEGIREKQLEIMLECEFPTDTRSYRFISPPLGRRSETGYDIWDHLEAKVALIRYMGPYRTI